MQTIPLDNGERVVIEPLSPFVQIGLLQQVRADFPLPDPEAYRQPLKNALDPDLKEPADMNPAYVKAYNAAATAQDNAFREAVIRAGAVVACEGESNEATIARYAAKLARTRGVLRGLPDDDWTATVMACLITTRSDVGRVTDAANGLLKREDVARALDTFPGEIQRDADSDSHPEADTSGLPEQAGDTEAGY